MCEVCAIFGVGEHWAESAPLAAQASPALDIQHHRRERRRRIALLYRWLAGNGVSVRDWDGEAFVVEDDIGRTRLAADLSSLWPAIEALAGRSFDPLSEAPTFGPR
jgi:hypothetical protein